MIELTWNVTKFREFLDKRFSGSSPECSRIICPATKEATLSSTDMRKMAIEYNKEYKNCPKFISFLIGAIINNPRADKLYSETTGLRDDIKWSWSYVNDNSILQNSFYYVIGSALFLATAIALNYRELSGCKNLSDKQKHVLDRYVAELEEIAEKRKPVAKKTKQEAVAVKGEAAEPMQIKQPKKENTMSQFKNANKKSITLAIQLEAGSTAITVIKGLLKKSKMVPMMARGYIEHPIADIIIANALSMAANQMPSEPRLKKLADLSMDAAYINTAKSFNIQEAISTLIEDASIQKLLESVTPDEPGIPKTKKTKE